MLQAAAERCLEFMCARFTDPVYFGDYPKSIRDRILSLPQFTPEQQAQLKGSADFFLINHYSSKYISHKADCSGEDGMSLFDGSSSVQHTERKGKPIGQQVTEPHSDTMYIYTSYDIYHMYILYVYKHIYTQLC